nr:MAG TPA: hypothetical protein [Caudoviricetes sp.]
MLARMYSIVCDTCDTSDTYINKPVFMGIPTYRLNRDCPKQSDT